MAHPDYINEVLGIWLFNNDLEDVIAGNDFAEDNSQVSSYSQFQRYSLTIDAIQTNYGLVLGENTYSTGSDVAMSSSFTLSFWYYSPRTLGFTRHVNTNKLHPKFLPIIGKGTINSSQTNSEHQVVESGVFILTEVGWSSSENVIQLDLCQNQNSGNGNGRPTHRFVSDSFTPGLHHVYATFNASGGTGSCRIDVDGKFGSTYWFGFTPVGSSSAPLRLNSLYDGHVGHKATNSGAYIADLVVRNNAGNDSHKAYRFGWESITRQDQYYDLWSFFGVSYNQPSTITTNQIWTEGGNIYVARSNGEILKGMRPYWDTEEDYTDTAQQGLELEGQTVRI